MEGTTCVDNLAAAKTTANQWAETATRCGTDQGPYMRHFWQHLNRLQSTAFTLLEIGVQRGRSLETWKELFPNATIYGLDIDPECAQYADWPRVKVSIGSQADPAVLEEWTKQVTDPIDVIIDDGSHVMEHLKTSFYHLFPKLRPGGIYVLEDLGTCYMPEFGGRLPEPSTKIDLLRSCFGRPKPSTMIEVLKSCVDNINANWSGIGNPLEIDHMHFYTNICFVYKK